MTFEAHLHRASPEASFAAVPGLHARLLAEPPARVAFSASGSGETALALAGAYAGILVDGWDADDAAIAAARREALARGLDDRVRFEVGDVTERGPRDRYDVVVVGEADDDAGTGADLERLRSIAARGAYVVVLAHPDDLAFASVKRLTRTDR
jgi:tRNA A58 N-methylase Trm61